MGNRNREAGYVLKQQLRQVYAEVERTKLIHLELLKAIWPCTLLLTELEHSEFGTPRAPKHVSD
jgi:hypothetical protein